MHKRKINIIINRPRTGSQNLFLMTTINEISNPDESYMGTLNLQFRDYPIDDDEKAETYCRESDDWNNFLEENQWKIYPLLANIMQVFLPTGNYQIMYTLYPQGFISVIAKPINK